MKNRSNIIVPLLALNLIASSALTLSKVSNQQVDAQETTVATEPISPAPTNSTEPEASDPVEPTEPTEPILTTVESVETTVEPIPTTVEPVPTTEVTSGVPETTVTKNPKIPDDAVLVEDGTYRTLDGTIYYEDGSIKYADGTEIDPKGVTFYPDGRVEYPNGTVEFPDGKIQYKNGTVKEADGTIRHINGTVEHPDGRIEFADGTVKEVDGTITYPDGRRKLLDGTIVDKEGKPIKQVSPVSPVINVPSPYVPVQDFISRPRTAPVSITNSGSPQEPVIEEEINLSKVIEPLLSNPSMGKAFKDYQAIIDMFEFNDEVSLELTGSSLEDVLKQFQPQAKENKIEDEHRTIIEYVYGEDANQAKLSLFFTSETLTAVAIEDANPVLDEVLSSNQKQLLAGASIKYSDVIALKPNIVGLVHKKFNTEGYDALVIPSGDENQYSLDFVEVHPNYVLSEDSLDFEPSSDEISTIIAEYVTIKQSSAETVVGAIEAPNNEISFVDQVLANRVYQEENLISLEEMELLTKEVKATLLESGKLEVNQIIEILGEPTEVVETGANRYDYYYAKNDNQVIIVQHQYDVEDNLLMQYSVDKYTEENPAFPMTINGLIELVTGEFKVATLEEKLGEPEAMSYSPGQAQIQYTWTSSEDEEMLSISVVIDLKTGSLDVFYNPVGE